MPTELQRFEMSNQPMSTTNIMHPLAMYKHRAPKRVPKATVLQHLL